MTKKHKIIFFLIILVTLVFYVLSLDFNYIGVYNDDAWYVLAARYLAGVQTGHEVLISRPIGYPLLLAPLAKLFPESIEAFRMPSFLMIFSLPFLIFYFMRDIFKPRELLLYTALIGLNQFSVILSGDVMSEAPCLFFTFLIIILFKKIISEKTFSIKNIFIFSFLLAFMFYLRSQGVLMFMAFFAYYAYKRKYKELMYMTFFYLVLIMPLLVDIKGFSAGSSMNKYMYEIGVTYGAAPVLKSAWGNLIYYFTRGLHTGVLSIVRSNWNAVLFKRYAVYFISAVTGFFIFCGFLKNNKIEYLKPVKIYMVLYLLLHIFWVNVSIRYLIPVFPFLIYYFLSGLRILKKKTYFAACVLLVIFCFTGAVRTAVTARTCDKSSTDRPMKTFRWVKENTGKNSKIFSNYIERASLYTGRKIVRIFFDTSDEFYNNLIENDIDYVLLFTSRKLQKSYIFSQNKIAHEKLRRYLISNIMKYEKIYENNNEETGVWRVIKSTEFIKAGEIARLGMEAFKQGRIEEAKLELEKAFDLYPGYETIAANLAVILMAEKNYEKALNSVNKAIKTCPGSAKLLAIRSDIYKAVNQPEKSVIDIKKALAIAEKTYDNKMIKILKIRGK